MNQGAASTKIWKRVVLRPERSEERSEERGAATPQQRRNKPTLKKTDANTWGREGKTLLLHLGVLHHSGLHRHQRRSNILDKGGGDAHQEASFHGHDDRVHLRGHQQAQEKEDNAFINDQASVKGVRTSSTAIMAETCRALQQQNYRHRGGRRVGVGGATKQFLDDRTSLPPQRAQHGCFSLCRGEKTREFRENPKIPKNPENSEKTRKLCREASTPENSEKTLPSPPWRSAARRSAVDIYSRVCWLSKKAHRYSSQFRKGRLEA